MCSKLTIVKFGGFMIDKGDIGSFVGVILGGTAAAASGLGAPLIIAASAGGAYIGHNLADPHNYKPIYSHK